MSFKIRMKTLILTFDLEPFIGNEFGLNIDEKKNNNLSLVGLKKIIELLDKNNIKSTFFTTFDFAEFAKKEINELIKKNHEIALHGYKHEDNYKLMIEKESFEKLKFAKKKLEDLFKIEIKGFRAPQMMHPSYELLNKLDFVYDSSYHPAYIPGRYNNFFKTRKIFQKGKLKIFPVSVTPFLRLPYSWLWFRNFGLTYSKICTNLNFLNSNFTHIYFHPWEFVDLKKDFKNKLNFLFYHNTGDKLISNLEDYIYWCKKKNLKNKTLYEYLKNGT